METNLHSSSSMIINGEDVIRLKVHRQFVFGNGQYETNQACLGSSAGILLTGCSQNRRHIRGTENGLMKVRVVLHRVTCERPFHRCGEGFFKDEGWRLPRECEWKQLQGRAGARRVDITHH